jgi:hypothetical protein
VTPRICSRCDGLVADADAIDVGGQIIGPCCADDLAEASRGAGAWPVRS